jgi:hypothetical protein
MTGVAGALVFRQRVAVPGRPSQARVFTVALLVANSIYFFGRSHEHNLINISASYLFCFFMALDLGWPAPRDVAGAPARAPDAPPLLGWILRATPWVLVAVCAYAYSGRVAAKIPAQMVVVEGSRPIPPAFPGDVLPNIDCGEILRAAGNSRLYFFSKYDYWYYEKCAAVPRGYIQPLFLAIQVPAVIAQVTRVLDDGYKVVVPHDRDWGAAFVEILPRLGNLRVIDTAQYRLYSRPLVAQQP